MPQRQNKIDIDPIALGHYLSFHAVVPPPYDEKYVTERAPDGSWNDLVHPEMGMAGTRFGRNVPLEDTWPDREHILDPSPREVSRHLLARGTDDEGTWVDVWEVLEPAGL